MTTVTRETEDDDRDAAAEPPPSAASAAHRVAISDVTPRPPSDAAPPTRPSIGARLGAFFRESFLDRDPTFWVALAPLLLVALVLFTRWPGTNYIFDEQEALLANPYVNAVGGIRFGDVIHRDFWGLPPDHSIGSYRPIPDVFWRLLWNVSKAPFFHHIYNVFFHAINGAILTVTVFAWTKRRATARLAGALFVICAVLTEAVSGIVGIADVLGGIGAMLALSALSLPAWAMPAAVFSAITFGLFSKESALVCVPLVPFAALVAAPLTHPERPARALRAFLALVATVSAFYIYVELRRRWFPSPLPEELTVDLPEGASRAQHLARDFLVWFHQAPLPRDPMNNPLVGTDVPHRIAGALRVYWRGLTQVVFPKTLSGDYSFPAEPVPERLVFPESVAGAAMMVLPPFVAIGAWCVALVRERRVRRIRTIEKARRAEAQAREQVRPPLFDFSLPGRRQRARFRFWGTAMLVTSLAVIVADLVVLRRLGHVIHLRGIALWVFPMPAAVLALGLLTEALPPLASPDAYNAAVPLRRAGLCLIAIGLVWMVVSYFPHSNIPTVLPTVRAERFWYFPAIGTSMVLAVVFEAFTRWTRPRHPWLAPCLLTLFFGFQAEQAYRHATDYRNDLEFWESTKKAVPRSAKAHLNFSVMKGARNDLPTRLVESRIALDLAPDWPMASVYTADVLCRMDRVEEAWPYYKQGFEKGPNDQSLIALGLQCLYDKGALMAHEAELRALADAHEGSWIAYLAIDTLQSSDEYKGVDPKYRPRNYNEGPKDDGQ